MDFRARHAASLAALILALAASLAVLIAIWPLPELQATKLALLIGAAGIAALLWQRTQRTNMAIARFVAALDHRDLTQGFAQRQQGAGFDELGMAFDGVISWLRQERANLASQNHFAAALVDETPGALLTISPTGTVRPANKAARRLFGSGHERDIAAFARYGEGLVKALETIGPGQRRHCRVHLDGLDQRAMVAAAEVEQHGETWRIVSIEVIQGELDAAEVAAQTDLVRVLTHEIMNSMTPVTSLAETAAALVAQADTGADPGIADARVAVEALARRAAGILHFVESYREFSRTPSLAITTFDIETWIAQLVQIFGASPQGQGVTVSRKLARPSQQMKADADLLGQVILNLLKNGGEAAVGHAAEPRIAITFADTSTGRTRITILDNGPGVSPALAEDIFLPFFTTKPAGTGVGLSFARQVVLLHRGAITMFRQGPDFGFEILI